MTPEHAGKLMAQGEGQGVEFKAGFAQRYG